MSASPLLLALLLTLAGCGLAPELAGYPDEEGPAVAAAAWPRIVDIPDPAGVARDAPDPQAGAAIIRELGADARRAAAEAERLAGPVR